MTRRDPPDEWGSGPTCHYCKGHIPASRRVCNRCKTAKGSMTASQWLSNLVKARSKILIEHRVANDLGLPMDRRS